jgi:hypothetical protein
VTVAALAAPAAGAATSSGTGGTNRAGVTGCKKAKIGGRTKCLAAGQLCNRRYEKQYERNGFACVKSHGRYRLEANKLTF